MTGRAPVRRVAEPCDRTSSVRRRGRPPPRLLRLLLPLLLLVACDDDDLPRHERIGAPSVLVLPEAEGVRDRVEASPPIVVRLDGLDFSGGLFRLDLAEGRLPAAALDDGRVAGLRAVLETLRGRIREVQGLPADRPFRSVLVLRADARVPAATVQAAARTAAEVGFVTLQVVVETRAGQRQMPVRVELDVVEPHLQVLVDPSGASVTGPGLASALEAECGEAPDGPVTLGAADRWRFEDLRDCEARAVRAVLAEVPSAGISAVGDVRWADVVHTFARLRAAHPEPERLTLLLE